MHKCHAYGVDNYYYLIYYYSRLQECSLSTTAEKLDRVEGELKQICEQTVSMAADMVMGKALLASITDEDIDILYVYCASTVAILDAMLDEWCPGKLLLY